MNKRHDPQKSFRTLLASSCRAFNINELLEVLYGIASEQMDTRSYCSVKYFLLKNIEVLAVKCGG